MGKRSLPVTRLSPPHGQACGLPMAPDTGPRAQRSLAGIGAERLVPQ